MSIADRRLLFLIALIILIAGCASYNVKKFLTETKLDDRLPTLLILQSGDTSDLEQLVSTEISGNICVPYDSQVSGAIAFNVNVRDTTVWSSPAQWFYAVVSGLTLTSINLLGFPMGRVGNTVDLDVKIFDSHCKEIAAYTFSEKGVAHKALYWGYDGRKVVAVATAVATKKCMQKLKDQIAADNTKLRQDLAAAGTIAPDKLDMIFSCHPDRPVFSIPDEWSPYSAVLDPRLYEEITKRSEQRTLAKLHSYVEGTSTLPEIANDLREIDNFNLLRWFNGTVNCEFRTINPIQIIAGSLQRSTDPQDVNGSLLVARVLRQEAYSVRETSKGFENSVTVDEAMGSKSMFIGRRGNVSSDSSKVEVKFTGNSQTVCKLEFKNAVLQSITF